MCTAATAKLNSILNIAMVVGGVWSYGLGRLCGLGA